MIAFSISKLAPEYFTNDNKKRTLLKIELNMLCMYLFVFFKNESIINKSKNIME